MFNIYGRSLQHLKKKQKKTFSPVNLTINSLDTGKGTTVDICYKVNVNMYTYKISTKIRI